MSLQERLKEMQDFIASKLDETGQFTIIEPGYGFTSKTIDDSINKKSKEHIFVVKRPDFREGDETGEYLIITNAHEKQSQKPTKEEFFGKLKAASDAGILVVPLMYKFLNNEGLYWRRKTLSHGKPKKEWKEPAPYAKKSLDHLPKNARDRLRLLSTTLEREWVPAISFGFPVYYQPKSARLEEQLIRFRFSPIAGVYSDSSAAIKLSPETLEKTIDPINDGLMDLFTVRPMRRRYHGPNKELYKGKILSGDILALPNVKITDDSERKIQYELGRLQHGIKEAFISDTPMYYETGIRDLIERMSIQLRDSSSYQTDGMKQLSGAMGSLMSVYSRELDKILERPQGRVKERASPTNETKEEDPPWMVYTFYYESKSEPEKFHETQIMVSLEQPKEILHRCGCKGHKYWDKCWHIDDAMIKADIQK